MKYYYIQGILWTVVLGCCLIVNRLSASDNRLWDNAIVNLSLSDLIYTQISFIEQISNSTFDFTSTLIVSIDDQALYAQTLASTADVLLESLDNQLATLESAIEVVDGNSRQLAQEIESVQVNDFGGTWTSLMQLKQELTNSFESPLVEAESIAQELNSLLVSQKMQFAGTFTALQAAINNASLTSIVLESITDLLDINGSVLESILVLGQDNITSIQSKLDFINREIVQGFAGTFTAIAQTTVIAQSAQSVLDIIDNFVFVNVIDTYTTLSAMGQLIDTLESKVAIISTEAHDLESLTDQIYQAAVVDNSLVIGIAQNASNADATLITVESKLNSIATQLDNFFVPFGTFTDNIHSAFDVIGTIGSLIGVLDGNIQTFGSSVDILNSHGSLLLSDIESLHMNTLNSTINVMASGLASLVQTGSSISNQINMVGRTGQSMQSAITVLNQSFIVDASAIPIMASVVDHVGSSLNVLNAQLSGVDSAIGVLETQMAEIITDERLLTSRVAVAVASASVLDRSVVTLGSQLSVLSSRIDPLNSKIDKLSVTVIGDAILTITLLNDMQATWTMLNAINKTLSSIIVTESIASSQLANLHVTADLTGVYTTIAAIQVKATSLLPSVQTLASIISAHDTNCIMNLGPTFTAMTTTQNAIDLIDSAVDVLINDINFVLNYDGYGVSIPVDIGSISTTTYVISSGGRYALQNSVNFSPGNTTCIFINASNVHLNLSNLTISQVGATAGTVAILVANGASNISIENGTINNFTGGAIQFLGNNNVVRLSNLRLVGNGSSQLVINSANFNQGASNVILDGIQVVGTGGSGDCITCNKVAGLFIYNCILYGAVSPGGGISLRGCNYVDIRNCATNLNNAYGIGGVATTNSFGMIDFAIDSCVALNNTGDGLRFAGFNQNGVITNCVMEENANGIRFTNVAGQLLPSSSNYVGNNVCSRNTSYGIYLDASVNRNEIAFNQMFINGLMNFQEDSGEGPNTVLGNYAYRAVGTNYTTGLTSVNRSSLRDSTAFPATQPTYWINADVNT